MEGTFCVHTESRVQEHTARDWHHHMQSDLYCRLPAWVKFVSCGEQVPCLVVAIDNCGVVQCWFKEEVAEMEGTFCVHTKSRVRNTLDMKEYSVMSGALAFSYCQKA